jgi:integrase/recombinase XerD
MEDKNEGFKLWLQTMGFAASSVKSLPRYSLEMLLYFKERSIEDLTGENIVIFFQQWKQRKNKQTGAGLSHHHISKCITALQNFGKYLEDTEEIAISIHLEREKMSSHLPQVLSKQEIESLYESTYQNTKRVNHESYGQRDRAMLGIYYGCGLRKSEGNSLEVSDIDLVRGFLYVRKGKGNKERYVPIAGRSKSDIEIYLAEGRNWFLAHRFKHKVPNTAYFFVNLRGEQMLDFSARLRHLAAESGIKKPVYLHILRHSIATHLLAGGMSMEQIRKFLGHSSLESTQVYTHIVHGL